MKINLDIKTNVIKTVHPLGCFKSVDEQIEAVKQQGKFNGPKTALILGASSGYGLASKIALGIGANTRTISVAFELAESEERFGTAGFYNSYRIDQILDENGVEHYTIFGDAFSKDMKEKVFALIAEKFGKIDLLIYSLAAPKRKDEDGNVWCSTLKTIGEVFEGKTFDFENHCLIDGKISSATQEETLHTIKVMGGEDLGIWVNRLVEKDLVNQGFKAFSYSYFGPKLMERIYKNGTIGQAKRDIEKVSNELNLMLQEKVNGACNAVVAKAVTTKASAFIPLFPLYAAALYKIEKENGNYEGTIEQMIRLFKDNYEESQLKDDQNRIRIDNLEMQASVQLEAEKILETVTDDNFKEVLAYDTFYNEFLKLNGFGHSDIDYEQDVELGQYKTIK